MWRHEGGFRAGSTWSSGEVRGPGHPFRGIQGRQVMAWAGWNLCQYPLVEGRADSWVVHRPGPLGGATGLSCLRVGGDPGP